VTNAFSQDRYQVWMIEARGPYRFKVIDTDRSGKIVARTASQETADSIAKQMNEKGFVEAI
jgi:hypothetical protein